MRALKITHSITRRDEKSMEKYLTEISRYDVLTPGEELQLFREYRNGDASALKKIVQHNLRFVVSVSKQYQHLGLFLGDLINEGNIGLMKAARRFDETRGFKFISYAVWWIRQSILQAVNEKSRKIRLPLSITGQTTKIMHKRVELLQHMEREPTLQELSEATELPEHTVKKCLETYHKCTSLDAPVNEDSETSMSQLMMDYNVKSPDYNVAIRETQQVEVQSLLRQLPPRQASVLSMYYGIGRENPINLSDIADYIGVSRERVRQIRDQGLLRLRVRAKDLQPTFAMG